MNLKPYPVTENSMRPYSTSRACYYCGQPVGGIHAGDCVLIKKTVRIRTTIEHEITVPAHWDKDIIEFHRNESSWCSGNLIEELEKLSEKNGGCLCGETDAEYIGGDSDPFLKEK